MPTAIINQPHARVQLTGERLEILLRDEDTGQPRPHRQIPLRDLDRLIISDTVHFTTPALAALLSTAVPLQLFSWQGRYLGGFLPAQNQHGLARLHQYQRTLDPAFGRQIAGRLITAKLYNQRRVIQRLAASRGWLRPEQAGGAPLLEDPSIATANQAAAATATRHDLTWLDARFRDLETAASIDELRGYEGATTARYFAAWSRFLPAAFPFERRSTRPPHNPVNACISFGATLLYSEAVAFSHAHGLDPALGALHTTADGRWSLDLDLLEPLPPPRRSPRPRSRSLQPPNPRCRSLRVPRRRRFPQRTRPPQILPPIRTPPGTPVSQRSRRPPHHPPPATRTPGRHVQNRLGTTRHLRTPPHELNHARSLLVA